MATKFHKLYTLTAEGLKLLKEPGTKKKVFRALEGAADSYEDQRIDTQDKIDKLTEKLALGDTSVIPSLIESRLSLQEIDAQAAEAVAIKDELDADEKD